MQQKLSELVLASNNQGKLKEFNRLFSGFSISVRPMSDWQIEDAVEDGLSFIENAIIKARHASSLAGLPAIADDSGLEVMCLKGEPGIYSARYADDIRQSRYPELSRDEANVQKLLQRLEGKDEMQRGARFFCALAFVRHAADPVPVIAEGSWYGEIAFSPSGENGFGYDPVFYLPDRQCTAATLEAAEKSRLSHRAQALEIMLQKLRNLQLIN